MNETKSDKQSDYICYCSGTTRETLLDLIDDGISDPDSLSRLTGACSGCGACETEILELLAETTSAAGRFHG